MRRIYQIIEKNEKYKEKITDNIEEVAEMSERYQRRDDTIRNVGEEFGKCFR